MAQTLQIVDRDLQPIRKIPAYLSPQPISLDGGDTSFHSPNPDTIAIRFAGGPLTEVPMVEKQKIVVVTKGTRYLIESI